jgi:hypothetical protein
MMHLILKSQAYKKYPFRVRTLTTSNMIITWQECIALEY